MKSMTWITVILCLLFQAMGSIARAESPEGHVERQTQGLATGGNTWDSPFIVVCWETGGAAAPQQWVREAVERTWMHESRLAFAGWGPCSANTKGIRISIENGPFPAGNTNSRYGWPRADIGHSGGINHMALTFDFVAQAAQFSGCQAGASGNRKCIESIAVHEFGHALGFAHEQDRSDVPVTCVSMLGADYAGAGQGGVTRLGPFDQGSIMAYCNAAWNNDGRLSANDIFYVQSIYGRKAAGAIVSFDGRCLDTAGGSANSAVIQTYECLGGTQFAPGGVASANQRWFYSPRSAVPAFTLANTKRVLDVPRNDATTGNQLQLFDFLGTPGQRWTMPNARIRSMGGMCLKPVSAPVKNGTELGLYNCDYRVSTPDLNFDHRSDGTIVHEGSKLCAAMPGGGGSRIVLNGCDGGAGQKFSLTAAGSITGSNGLCLDIGMPQKDLDRFFGVDGLNRLQAWQCNGHLNQQFSFAGSIVGLANKCVDVRAFGMKNGTPVQLWDCNRLENQQFEVVW